MVNPLSIKLYGLIRFQEPSDNRGVPQAVNLRI